MSNSSSLIGVTVASHRNDPGASRSDTPALCGGRRVSPEGEQGKQAQGTCGGTLHAHFPIKYTENTHAMPEKHVVRKRHSNEKHGKCKIAITSMGYAREAQAFRKFGVSLAAHSSARKSA